MLRKSTTPLYHQLRELITEKIESGEWEPGRRLPTEYELMAEFGVSRATVRQAMQMLENQGLIEREQGRGTFVGRPKVANDLLSLWVFSPQRDLRIQLQHLKTDHPASSVARRLEISTSDEVYELKRIVLMDEEPLMIITSWLPVRLFPGLDEMQLDGVSIRRIVENYHSFEGLHQYKEVEIAILSEEEAGLLQAHSGAPALLLTYLQRLADGQAMEYRKVIVRGDRCKYYAHLDMPENLL
jgi:GntR family transcriptional regulator